MNPVLVVEGAFPVVAVCASAGGLAAFREFLTTPHAEISREMALVLIQHLDPIHKSLLPELIRGFSSLEVFEVTDGLTVAPGCVYVVPPGQEMTLVGGRLCLTKLQPFSRSRLPINVFLESLARDKKHLAAAVILSGTGTDGTLGSLAIARQGGLVLAQTLASAEYPGMPSSVIASGQVDAVLPPQDMLPALGKHFLNLVFPPADDPTPQSEFDPVALDQILSQLKSHTAHDFTQYKPSTLRRRIERRMAHHRIETLDEYLRHLQEDPHEIGELFQDILIGVTSFYRDPEVFATLENSILPDLIRRRPPGAKLRVWSAGCSTGEESYTLAILLRKTLDALTLANPLEIFATDIDQRAIKAARAGVYGSPSVEGLTPEDLQNYFVPGQAAGTLRITKEIRNLVVFSEHDVVKDPPFLKLDLLSCRNLLIYFNLDLQKRLLPMFYYALNPGGILLLGTSETIGEFSHLFQPLDRDKKIFLRREAPADLTGVGSLPPSLLLPRDPSLLAKVLPRTPVEAGSALSLQDLTEEALLDALEVAAVLVDEWGEVFYLHGRTGAFLEPAPGVATSQNLLKMAKDGLKHPLAAALHQARISNEVVRPREVELVEKHVSTGVQLGVHPLSAATTDQLPRLFLVVFEERPARKASQSPNHPEDERLERLKDELRTQEEYLRSTTERMERSNEELRSSNEELQAVNEELQSTNEELDTSKEELQSVNEELSTVNDELTSKVNLLTTTLNDMNNLLAATGVATVFVDLKMNILRFTPEATKIINLVPSDVGRPVGHLTSNLLNYQDLERDTQTVLDSLNRFEIEVQTKQDSWYRLRIQPYRTLDNVIEGAVISFGDINEIVRQRGARVAVLQDSPDAMMVQDLAGNLLAWNPAAVRLYGWTEQEALTPGFCEYVPREHRAEEAKRMRDLVSSDGFHPFQAERRTKDGRTLEVSVLSTPLLTKEAGIYGYWTTERVKGWSIVT